MTDALANERTARHLMAIGEVSAAEPYFREACSSYEKWGGEVDSSRTSARLARATKNGEARLNRYIVLRL
jgi:hypothetical protein